MRTLNGTVKRAAGSTRPQNSLHIDDSDRVQLPTGPPNLVGTKSRPRLVAMIADNALAIPLAFVISSKLPVPDESLRGVILVAAYLGYYLVPEAIWGRTPMKKACHLIVRRLDGSECGWKEAAIRTAARVFELNPLLLGALPGALAVAWSNRHQRLGDMLARTVVVSEK